MAPITIKNYIKKETESSTELEVVQSVRYSHIEIPASTSLNGHFFGLFFCFYIKTCLLSGNGKVAIVSTKKADPPTMSKKVAGIQIEYIVIFL